MEREQPNENSAKRNNKMANREQPTEEIKIRTLRGEQTGWDFAFTAPPVPTTFWSNDGWIAYIGDGWFRIKESVK